MTRLSDEEIIQKIKDRREEVTVSKEVAMRYLCSLGTHKSDGTLTEEYSVN